MPVLAAALILFAGVFAGAFFIVLSKMKSQEASSAQMLQAFERGSTAMREQLNGQILELSKQMNEHLVQNNRMLNQNTQQYAQAIGQVQNRLGELQEATRRMAEIGKDIASLQDILQAPKLRGGLGEFILEELLRQVLPQDAYEMQYTFQTGHKVDAVIRWNEKLIPVDAKFPLENFRKLLQSSGEAESRLARREFVKDVKKHIDAIAAKYILPGEKTLDFAFMCIPAENVYYEILFKQDSENEGLLSYAWSKKVFPVSPNSFYAYLMALAHGFKGQSIARSAQLILERMNQLGVDFQKCMTDFEKLGTHLQNAASAYKNAEKRLEKFQDRIGSLDQAAAKEPDKAIEKDLLNLSGNGIL